MPGGRSRRTDRLGHGPSATDETTAKVVLMELATANEPLSTGELSERTLLSETALVPILEDLAAAGLCTVLPADGNRQHRFTDRGE